MAGRVDPTGNLKFILNLDPNDHTRLCVDKTTGQIMYQEGFLSSAYRFIWGSKLDLATNEEASMIYSHSIEQIIESENLKNRNTA